jgi:hypothetical protein
VTILEAAVLSVNPAALLRRAPCSGTAHQDLVEGATIHICDLGMDFVSLAELQIDLAMPDEQRVSSRGALAVWG